LDLDLMLVIHIELVQVSSDNCFWYLSHIELILHIKILWFPEI
jgi:hypothetical protein